MLAVFEEHEGEPISWRTKDALKAVKARGVKLGNLQPHEVLQNARVVHRAEARAESPEHDVDVTAALQKSSCDCARAESPDLKSLAGIARVSSSSPTKYRFSFSGNLKEC